jgi:hypothetical protein
MKTVNISLEKITKFKYWVTLVTYYIQTTVTENGKVKVSQYEP